MKGKTYEQFLISIKYSPAFVFSKLPKVWLARTHRNLRSLVHSRLAGVGAATYWSLPDRHAVKLVPNTSFHDK